MGGWNGSTLPETCVADVLYGTPKRHLITDGGLLQPVTDDKFDQRLQKDY